MQLSQKLRSSPFLFRLLFPFWMRYHSQWFHARNILTHNHFVYIKNNGRAWRFHPQGQIMEGVFWGVFERAVIDFVLNYLRPGMCVVDAGANVGLYSVLASTMVTPGGEVHAFEPSVQTFELLNNNLQLNKSQNVKSNLLALSDTDEAMVLRVDSRHPNYDAHRFVEKIDQIHNISVTGTVVQSNTLDNYLLENAVGPVNFF